MRRYVAPAFLVLITLGFTVWQLNHLGGLRWDWDEGVYLSSARLANQGRPLYGEVFSTASPLFLNSIQAGFLLAGESVAAGRGAMVLYAGLGLLAIGLIARELSGEVAAFAAIAALAIAPHFYMLSRVAIADVPSMALAACAIWAALRFSRGGRAGWVPVAGFILSLGGLMKLTALLAGPAIVYYLVRRTGWSVRRLAVVGALCMGGFAVPLALYAPALDWRACVDQTIVLIWNQTGTFVPDHAANLETVWRYLILDNRSFAINRGMSILGLLGLLAVTRRKPGLAAGVWLWLAGVLYAMLSYAPLWPHLLSPLVFPLALGAGLGIGELWTVLRPIGGRRRTVEAAAAGLLAIGALVYAADLPRIIREDGKRGAAPDGDAEREAIVWLAQHTAPEERIVTDEPLLAFAAARSVPPGLADTSIVRIAVGSVTSEQAIRETQNPQTTAVVLWKDNRFATYFPDYVRWLEAEWQPAKEWDASRRIFVRKEASVQ